MIKQSEIDEAAESFIIKEHLDTNSDLYYRETFKAGVEFAQSKFQEMFMEIITENQGLKLYKDNETERFRDLAIGFYDWTKDNVMQFDGIDRIWSNEYRVWEEKNYKELFDKFLEDKHNGSIS